MPRTRSTRSGRKEPGSCQALLQKQTHFITSTDTTEQPVQTKSFTAARLKKLNVKRGNSCSSAPAARRGRQISRQHHAVLEMFYSHQVIPGPAQIPVLWPECSWLEATEEGQWAQRDLLRYLFLPIFNSFPVLGENSSSCANTVQSRECHLFGLNPFMLRGCD